MADQYALPEPRARSRQQFSLAGNTACVILSVGGAFAIEIGAHLYRSVPGTSLFVSQLMTLVAIAVLISPAVYLSFKVDQSPVLRLAVILSSVCLLLTQVFTLLGDVPSLNSLPVFGGDSPISPVGRWVTLLLGLVLVFGSLYMSLITLVDARGKLQQEGEELALEVMHRKRAAAALEEQEDLYRRAISQAGAIPYRINWKERKYTFFEDDVSKITGYEPGELTFDLVQSLPIETRFLGPLSDLTPEEVEAKRARGELRVWQAEYRIRTKNGEERWVADSSVEIVGDDAIMIESVGLFQDITERKRADEEKYRRERFLGALIESSLDLTTVLTEDGAILYESPSIEQVLGYGRNELNGQSVFDYIHPDDLPAILDIFSKGIQNPDIHMKTEVRIRHKDGSWRVFESMGRNYLNDPSIRGAVINSRDITARKNLEEQLAQSQKMEGIGRLAGGVAHDFNNLLTAITCFGELLSKRMSGVDSKNQEYVDQVLNAAYKASDLTRQLLAFARKQMIEPRNVDLNELTVNIERMLTRLIGEDVELVTAPQPNLGIVRIDPGQFEQVLVNLVINARDAMPTGGTITIETADVHLDESYANDHSEVTPGHYVMLAISDTGIGMPEDVQAKIFEPFFTTKEAGKGTGLGLATCYGIVKQAGGHIWVYSEVEKGTTFKIYFPRCDSAATSRSNGEKASPSAGSETVLLVEDEKLVRAATKSALESQGYHVIEAASGSDAIAIASRNGQPIHLLVTDVVMPKMSGREVGDKIRRIIPGLKILYMSGYTENAVAQFEKLAPGTEFISKPFTPMILTQRVRSILDKPTTRTTEERAVRQL